MTTVGEEYDKFRVKYSILIAHDIIEFVHDYPTPLFKNMSEAIKFEMDLRTYLRTL